MNSFIKLIIRRKDFAVSLAFLLIPTFLCAKKLQICGSHLEEIRQAKAKTSRVRETLDLALRLRSQYRLERSPEVFFPVIVEGKILIPEFYPKFLKTRDGTRISVFPLYALEARIFTSLRLKYNISVDSAQRLSIEVLKSGFVGIGIPWEIYRQLIKLSYRKHDLIGPEVLPNEANLQEALEEFRAAANLDFKDFFKSFKDE